MLITKKKWEDEKENLENQISFYENQITELNQSIKRNEDKIKNEINPYITTCNNDYDNYISQINESFQQVSNFILSNKYCKREASINMSDYTNHDFILVNNNYSIDDIYNIKYNKITIIDNKQKNESDSIIKTTNTVKLDNLSTLLHPYENSNTNDILNCINSTLEL